MKAKSLLLTGLLVVTGLTFLSLPAGAECWMTCPPGSTATPNSTGKQGATATTEPAVSPEERTPAKEPDDGEGVDYFCTCEAEGRSDCHRGGYRTGRLARRTDTGQETRSNGQGLA